MSAFAYLDEIDLSYGLTGAAISAFAIGDSSIIANISLDDSDHLALAPEYCFSGNPRMSAKITWNELLKQYQLFIAMLLGNIACRYYVHYRRQLPADKISQIKALIHDDGTDYCSLDDDEIDALFSRNLRYALDLYSDRRVASIADRFATGLRSRRRISAGEILDEFRRLGLA